MTARPASGPAARGYGPNWPGARLADGITEAVFQTRIVELCRLLRLRVFHSGDSRRDLSAGFPDLVIVGPRGFLVAELKTERGRETAEQTAWRRAFTDAGVDAYLWRPRDWVEIQRALYRLSDRPMPHDLRED